MINIEYCLVKRLLNDYIGVDIRPDIFNQYRNVDYYNHEINMVIYNIEMSKDVYDQFIGLSHPIDARIHQFVINTFGKYEDYMIPCKKILDNRQLWDSDIELSKFLNYLNPDHYMLIKG